MHSRLDSLQRTREPLANILMTEPTLCSLLQNAGNQIRHDPLPLYSHPFKVVTSTVVLLPVAWKYLCREIRVAAGSKMHTTFDRGRCYRTVWYRADYFQTLAANSEKSP